MMRPVRSSNSVDAMDSASSFGHFRNNLQSEPLHQCTAHDAAIRIPDLDIDTTTVKARDFR
jgi:hypothetical protein